MGCAGIAGERAYGSGARDTLARAGEHAMLGLVQPSSRSCLRVLPFAAVLALWCAASPAGAQEKNPAVEACAGKSEGAPCSTQRTVQDADGHATPKSEPGSCQPDECCTLDYSSGSPPKSNCAPCLACKAGPAAAGDGGSASPDSAGGEPPRSGDDGPPPHDPKKKGCSIDEAPLGGAPSILLLLALVGRARRRSAAAGR
jgi:hypothetical protein